MHRSLRLPRRPSAASEETAPETATLPELEQLARGSKTTSEAHGAPAEVEDVEGPFGLGELLERVRSSAVD